MSRALLASALAFLLLAAPAASSHVYGQDDDARALLARGEDAEKAQHSEEAVQAFKRLLEKFPNAPQAARAHLHLGLVLAKLGRSDEARPHLREARRLGKDDDEVQREAERALIALPPPAEPKTEPKKEAPKKAKPAPAPETGPRAELQADIEKLENEKRALTKKAQDLEDAGKTAEAYQVRAELDRKVAQIEKKKKELAGMPRGGRPMLPNREQRREERKERRAEREEKTTERPKLMLKRKEDFEAAARAALREAHEALSQNRGQEAVKSLVEYHRLMREAENLGKKAEGGVQHIVDTPEAKIDRLAADLKRRGAPGYEIEERVAVARRELQLDEEHRLAVAMVQKDLDDKKVAEPEARERMTRLDREHHKRIERLREEAETRVHDRGRAEMEKELARRAEELRKSGASDAEVEQKVAALRRELEPKIPGRRAEGKLGEAAADNDHPKRVRELVEENRRLRKRVEELEKENARLKGGKNPETAASPN